MSNKNDQLEKRKKSGISDLFRRKNAAEVPSDNAEEREALAISEQSDGDSLPEQHQYTLDESECAPFAENESESEGITVEKSQINISSDAVAQVSEEDNSDSKPVSDGETAANAGDIENQNGRTAVFTFAKDLPAGTEISHEELSLSELEDSAKSYFNATHTDSIDERVNELCRLADSGFEEDVADEESALQPAAEPKKKKKKKRDVISDDDIEMLAALSDNNPEEVQAQDGKPAHDELDKHIFQAFGLSEKDDDGFNKRYESLLSDDEPEVEYTDRLQENTIIHELRTGAIKSMLSVVLTLIATILCVYFETSAGTGRAHPAFFEPGRYGAVYALSMLQLMFFAVMFNLDGMKRAFKGLNPSKARPEGLCAVTVCICTLYTVASLTLAGSNPSLRSYCAVGCLSVLLLSVNSFIKAYTSLTSFCVAASKKPKYSTTELDASSEEAAAFAKYLEPDTSIFTVSENDFISGFFRKTFAVPEATRSSFKLACISVTVGVVCGAFAGITASDAYRGFTVGCSVALAGLPVNLMLATALPFLLSSLKNRHSRTAFIGEAACDAYTSAGIISFDDSEVFPPKSVKVSSIKTYGDTRIDKVIIYMARIFDKLKGPLSYVFENSVQGGSETVGEAQVVEQLSDGLRIKIDDLDILLGTSGFMKLYDLHTPYDNIDESFLQSLGSIMYMSVNGELAAKFYIKYAINKGFEEILRSLYDAGVCAGVKTYDPCVNNQLICGNLKGSNYPVSVIRKAYTDEENAESKVSGGSIISLSGTHSFLKGFISLDRLRNVYRSNVIVGTVCAVLSMLVTAAVTLSGAVSSLGVSFFIVLQLLWCLPAVMFSLLNK